MRNKILICGEAWGKDEAEQRLPFVGASGRILNGILRQTGIERRECHVTNVFNLQPRPTNDVINLCGPKSEGIPGMPPIKSGKYIMAVYKRELDRLYSEVKYVQPNLILAFGATAAWAFFGTSGIKSLRGAPALSTIGVPGIKVLPTYHPAAIMRDYKLRPVVIADCLKAAREAEFPEVRRPHREIWVEPTLADLDEFYEKYIAGADYVSVDIENIGPVITCIGFAPSIDRCLVVPFYDRRRPGNNYWPSHAEEMAAWAFVDRICGGPIPKIFQNGLYDMHHMLRTMGVRVVNAEDDTMLLHHALQPELEKGLGFLGSIYTDEASWKFMRKKEKNTTLKKED